MVTAKGTGLTHVLSKLGGLVRCAGSNDRPVVVFITGVDTSGKTEFSKSFADDLRVHGQAVQIVHVDDFHNPKVYRYSGPGDEADRYYERSFDWQRLLREVILPVRTEGSLQVTLPVLDVLTDVYELTRTYSVDSATVVLVEGVFLMRAEFHGLADLTVYLHVSSEEVLRRAVIRDVPILGDSILGKYHTKYIPAQERYLSRFDPRKHADMVIDNTDWLAPKIIWQRS